VFKKTADVKTAHDERHAFLYGTTDKLEKTRKPSPLPAAMETRQQEVELLFGGKGLKFHIPTTFEDGFAVRPAAEYLSKPADKRDSHSAPGWVEFSFGVEEISPSFSSTANLAKEPAEDKMDI